MLSHDTRHKIEDIISGAVLEGQQGYCTAIRNALCSRFGTSETVKKYFESKSIIKEEQARFIAEYCGEHGLWYESRPGEDRYLTRGGEASVYLADDNRQVIKLNDAIYYATWVEFFNSILLHNVLFENTAYELLGFVIEGGVLFAVLQQPFIYSDSLAELGDIRKMLEFNGFTNTRRNDYYHTELGLILEDMHDENVIVNSETLFFIDSVFYVSRIDS